MTDAVQKTECKRKPSAVFAQRYREKARNLKQQFDQNLENLEINNARLKIKEQQLKNLVAWMKSHINESKNKDSNLSEPISASHYVAPDVKGSTRVLNNNHVHSMEQFDHNQTIYNNIPYFDFVLDEGNLRSPVQPEAREEERIQVINSQSRTDDMEFLHNFPMDFEPQLQSTGNDQNLVELKSLDIDSVCGNSSPGDDLNAEEMFDLEAIYNILPLLSLHQGELNNLEVMKIEEMLRKEAAVHSYAPVTNDFTVHDKINGPPSVNFLLDPNKADILLADSWTTNSPYSTPYTSYTPGDQYQHDDLINSMLTDDNMEMNFELF